MANFDLSKDLKPIFNNLPQDLKPFFEIPSPAAVPPLNPTTPAIDYKTLVEASLGVGQISQAHPDFTPRLRAWADGAVKRYCTEKVSNFAQWKMNICPLSRLESGQLGNPPACKDKSLKEKSTDFYETVALQWAALNRLDPVAWFSGDLFLLYSITAFCTAIVNTTQIRNENYIGSMYGSYSPSFVLAVHLSTMGNDKEPFSYLTLVWNLINLAKINRKSSPKESNQLFQAAIVAAEASLKFSEYKYEKASTYIQIGKIYDEIGDQKKAVEFYLQGYKESSDHTLLRDGIPPAMLRHLQRWEQNGCRFIPYTSAEGLIEPLYIIWDGIRAMF